MVDSVTLDAMIARDDFATIGKELDSAEPIKSLSVDIIAGGMITHLLRKPDFQRETNHWSPNQVLAFLESFLDNELIPSLILWNSKTNVFVIDGAHRLSSLRAWIVDDYGDGTISKQFFSDELTKEQVRTARKTRKLVEENIGSYKELREILIGNLETNDERKKSRATNMVTRDITLQWVKGDVEKAESSFFKINTKGTPLDKVEEIVLRNRKKSVAIAARSVVRAATGHKYWSKFSPEIKLKIEENAKFIHNALFNPEVDSPIKTLDLPVGGTKSPLVALDLLMNLISITNSEQGENRKDLAKFEADIDGNQTLLELEKCKKLVGRISGNDNGSLGLHPAVYYYSERGRHNTDLLLGMLLLVKRKSQCNDKGFFKKFSSVRASLEQFLIENKSLIIQGMQAAMSKVRYIRVADLFDHLIASLNDGQAIPVEDVLKILIPNSSSKLLTITNTPTTKDFSDDTKSAIFIRQALSQSMKCPICQGYLDPTKSSSYDHIQRVQDGGKGSSNNGQITHPYCNQSIKN